ncbi:MAG: methyltransferase domain-containing protein [Candidatus Riflebacteria bacterium]|nr:methyltransferase domain-containing protein [Candidatus Riflebacteria bacterium]
MRQNVKDFAFLTSSTLPIAEPIYEFGSFQIPGQIGFADLRPCFPQKNFTGCDLIEGPGVDKILDLHEIDLPSESAGTVLCFDTLEHVEYPHQALKEIHRILRPDGIVVITSVMNFPIHDCPNDYWRFTPEGFKSLLKPFSNSLTGFQGKETFPHTVVGIGFKETTPPLTEFLGKFKKWQNTSQQVQSPSKKHADISRLIAALSRFFKKFR